LVANIIDRQDSITVQLSPAVRSGVSVERRLLIRFDGGFLPKRRYAGYSH